MPTSKGKQRVSTSGLLTQVRADENGNGVAKRTAGEKKKKIMRLKEFRALLERKLKYDVGTNAKHIKNWVKAKKPYLPPRSPFSLLQELFFYDPWKVLIACMFLNKTSGKQVSTVLFKFFSRYPTPIDLKNSVREDVIAIIKPLGLYNKRADMIVNFTKEYLQGNWRMPDMIKGIGKYANDAYRIFCCGEYKDVQPNDHALNKYHEWLLKEENKDAKEDNGSESAPASQNSSNNSQDSQNPLEISSEDEDNKKEDEDEQKKTKVSKTKKNSGVKESKSAHHQAFLVAGELKWNIRREDLNITQEERDWWSELFEVRDYFYKKFQKVEIEAESDEISESEEASEKELPKKARPVTKKRKIENDEDVDEKPKKKKQKVDKEQNKVSKQDKKEEQEEKKLEKARKKEAKKKKQIERSAKVNSLASSSFVITKTNLPPGWRFEVRQRQSGGTKGREDYYWYSPQGKKFRSLVEIRKHLAKPQVENPGVSYT